MPFEDQTILNIQFWNAHTVGGLELMVLGCDAQQLFDVCSRYAIELGLYVSFYMSCRAPLAAYIFMSTVQPRFLP